MWRYTRRAVVALSSHIWLMLPRTLAGWSVLIAAVTAACGFCFLAVVIHRAQVSLLCDSSAACPSAGCILCPPRRSSTHCALLCRVRQDREEEWTGPRPKGPINKTSSEWRALATGSPHGTRSRKRAVRRDRRFDTARRVPTLGLEGTQNGVRRGPPCHTVCGCGLRRCK